VSGKFDENGKQEWKLCLDDVSGQLANNYEHDVGDRNATKVDVTAQSDAYDNELHLSTNLQPDEDFEVRD